ncbi:alpha/beta-hydrolase family protein [Nocardia higoensis]|uniref:alpha/beta-hydrolase family protein n=1 Tax=Nocardia higoensis TaxID=228599 RepID=UPI0003191B8E|nr:alpha/beta-hydrolase family protein [Nocardia higoensis]
MSTTTPRASGPASTAYRFEDGRPRGDSTRAGRGTGAPSPSPRTHDKFPRLGHTAPDRRFGVPSPRIGTSLGVAAGVLCSLAPGLLPRTAGAQAILTGALVAASLAVAAVLGWALRRIGVDTGRRAGRAGVAVAVAVLIAATAWRAGRWQNELRAAMGVAAIDPWYWARCAFGAAALAGVLVAAGRISRRAVGALGTGRMVVGGMIAALAGWFVLAPGIVEWRMTTYASANAALESDAPPRVPAPHSGSAGSVVDWTDLGKQGRRFVDGAADGPIRVYVGVESAPDLRARVALAIRELERSGGFTRGNIVVAVPTGSGWIDGNAVAGFAERFGDDVAVVGLQYAYTPSWVSFVFGREQAVEAARALFTAIEERVARTAPRPRLFVYGQSLGAFGGSGIFPDADDQDRRTCAVLWAGPPANRAHRAGATVLANSSDPVVRWSPTLLWRAPDLTGVRRDAPAPRWLPVVSFVQTTADLLGALDTPAGHGHRYGTDQGTALGDCHTGRADP